MLTLTFLLLVVVVTAEWYSKLDFSLGVLYILPVLVAASVLNRWQTLLMAASCALIRGQFQLGLPPIEFWLRFAMAMLAYSGGGLLVGELSRNRRAIVEAYTKLKIEKEMRQQAEEQLRLLAESSPAAILTLTAVSSVAKPGLAGLNNSGPHGLSEILYAFSSTAANNGSAFAGLTGTTYYYNTLFGLNTLIGRFAMMVPMMALAGFLAEKKAAPESAGTFPVTTPLFTVLLVAVIVIVSALTFFPALALGPLVEHLLMGSGVTF